MNFTKKAKNSLIISLTLTTLSAFTLLVSFRWCFNSEDGYFVISAPPIVFSVLYFLGIAWALATTLSLDKSQIIKTKRTANKLIPEIIVACIIALTVFLCNLSLKGAQNAFSGIGVYALVIYIILHSVDDKNKSNTLKIILLYISVLFPASIYFKNAANLERHINSVENNLTVVFAASYMMYILYEAKSIYDGAHSRWHMGTMLLTRHSGASLSLAYIIAYFTKSVDEPVRFYQLLTTLAITAFVAIELLRFTRLATSHTQEEWDEIEAPEEETDPEETLEATETEN